MRPRKLTWFLEITGRRDDGMHELRSEMNEPETSPIAEMDP